MAWHRNDSMPNPLHLPDRRGRRGSLVIEAAIAVTLLATAAYGLSRIASGWTVLSRQADQRLTATLAAENARERLRRLSDEQLPEQADAIAAAIGEETGCQLSVTTTPFTDDDRDGVHVRVDVVPGVNMRVTLHDWRIIQQPEQEPESDADNQESETSESEVDDE